MLQLRFDGRPSMRTCVLLCASQVCQRKRVDVGLRLQSKCRSMRRHAQVNADNTFEKRERTGSWVRQVAQAIEVQLKEGQQELKTGEWKRKVEDARRIRRICHENKNKDLSHVQSDIGKLMHHDERELLSVWEGCHWDGSIRSCSVS